MTETNGHNNGRIQRGPGGAVDPTANVLALVEAAVKRLNDLQAASDMLRSLETKRTDDLRAAESRRIDEQLVLRSEYQDKLAMAEAKRIDAIRSVDVNAVAVASERASAQAAVLANQVAQSADALRTLVASTATTMATQAATAAQQFTERLTLLERSQYEGKGKNLVGDPQLAVLMEEVRVLNAQRTTSQGKSEGVHASWLILTGAIAAIATLISVGVLIYNLSRGVVPAYVPVPHATTTEPAK
jgi:hypothetical protein